ncbi:response regulator [Pseudomonas sp. dw_358]|uniref:response regulator n=1 Tax=Pseudomonas sp. dw_358 TaxID=2720083 RepID=UPI001BD38E99|nr:response regulator [Pseudomonas sp. dw_358]
MIRIGKLSVSLERREVLDQQGVVKLGSRAFDVLAELIAAQGQLVSKDQLLARVWPDLVVEENNLQVHVSTLRKLLGDEREAIRTVPGRGYRLILEPPVAPAVAAWWAPPHVSEVKPGVAVKADEAGLVYIVDDEPSVRVALGRLLRSAGIPSMSFACAEDFFACPLTAPVACLLLDVNLADASGFDLQQVMTERGLECPIIFMTGYGTIPMSVKAIKAGALEFLTKPFDENQLLDAVSAAFASARSRHVELAIKQQLRARYRSLTPREQQVLLLLLQGRLNKQIASELGTQEVTAKVHKKHIMAKMQARNLVELVRLCERIDIVAALDEPSFT